MRIFSKGITHNGVFHADDVFSTALLKLINPEFTVQRVPNLEKVSDDYIIYDIGGGRFDHHSSNILYHENGRRFASFGFLWNEYGEHLTGSLSAFKRIEDKFVSVIDESDNGGEYDMMSRTISSFNPSWNSEKNPEIAFNEAVEFAVKALSNIISRECSIDKADSEILKYLETMKDGIVIFDRFVPFTSSLIDSAAVYAIFPSSRGGYCIQGVPVSYESRDVKRPFPIEWRGASKERLKEISGIEELNFCHNTGFLAVADTIEAAMCVANYSIKAIK